jgi:hypothetical protein
MTSWARPRLAIRHSVPSNERDDRHVAEPQPRDIAGRAGYARRREQRCDTPGVVRLAIGKVRKSLGANQVDKLLTYTALEQENAWEQLDISILQIVKEGAGGRASESFVRTR